MLSLRPWGKEEIICHLRHTCVKSNTLKDDDWCPRSSVSWLYEPGINAVMNDNVILLFILSYKNKISCSVIREKKSNTPYIDVYRNLHQEATANNVSVFIGCKSHRGQVYTPSSYMNPVLTEAWVNWLLFCWRHFQLRFFKRNFSHFNWNVFPWAYWQWFSFGLGKVGTQTCHKLHQLTQFRDEYNSHHINELTFHLAP